MRFITEVDLRNLYRKEPFTSYEIKEGTRLTPGARQYLSDLRIKVDDPRIQSKHAKKKEQKVQQTQVVQQAPSVAVIINPWKTKKLQAKIKSTQALFLQAGQELLNDDIILAQKVIEIGKYVNDLQYFLEKKEKIVTLECKACHGMTKESFSQELDDCFELTQFHVQLEQGKKLILLHSLRCSLREMEATVWETYEGEEQSINMMIGRVNELINTLSQMICITFGGELCQRKR